MSHTKTPKPASDKQIRYLARLGVPERLARTWTAAHARAEIKLRLIARDSKPLQPVGPKLHGPKVEPQANYRLEASRAVTGPRWC